MEIVNSFKQLGLDNSDLDIKYKYINVFKNPSKLPINQIHLEKQRWILRKGIPKDLDILSIDENVLQKKYCELKTEIIPALDVRWLPKSILSNYEPYNFSFSDSENESFLIKNTLFINSLEYLLKCSYHQFWLTILFEPTIKTCLRSFIMNPITSFQVKYLKHEFCEMYEVIFNNFLLVYERLLNFQASDSEYMPSDYGLKCLTDNKLLNLPIVITLALLYKDSNINFVNRITNIYFNDTSQLDFQVKEVEEIVKQSLMVMEMIGGHLCGFDKDAIIVPIAISKRPPIFSLSWVYDVVNYLLNTMSTLNVLFQFYKPSVEISLSENLPFRLPFTYQSVYRELYEMLAPRDELYAEKELTERIFEEMNMGRNEFLDIFHTFVTYCLDKTLENMGQEKKQEYFVEKYLELLTSALDDEYFICDYDIKYNIHGQNETFESCFPLDNTRSKYITSCVEKLSRHKKLEEFASLQGETIENVFKRFMPIVEKKTQNIFDAEAGPSSTSATAKAENNVEELIQNILDMFPHMGDGFVLKCLEAYNFNSGDVINAILEENLPPHLYETPFDEIRIPPEPEPEKPVIAYKGKKPDYDDALKLLNDKKDIAIVKNFVLEHEGLQYSNDYVYDDEYDDRYDDDVAIRVGDNPITEELPTFNPNHEELASDTSYSSEEEYDEKGQHMERQQNGKAKPDFCENPELIRERREARFRARNPHLAAPPKNKDVVGKSKGQGQEKNVLQNRQKKNTNKSSRANHNRKSGATFKRNKGMIPS